MDLKSLINIKTKFVARQVADELVIVPLSGNVAQMNELFTLNETGKFIWESVTAESDIDTIATQMTEVFDIDEDTAKKDILIFLSQIDILSKYNQ